MLPTGTGKTMIAEAAVYEALRTGKRMYYTTPLIALTDQKLDELRESAVRWGFSADQVGLVTGNRRVNADAPVLVVVAEILLNRLLNPEAFDFTDVSSVVMDEFHSFNDRERGIVWELTLGAASLPCANDAAECHGWKCDGLHLVADSGSQPPLAIGRRNRTQGAAAILMGRR